MSGSERQARDSNGLEVQRVDEGETTTLRLVGELDLASVEKLGAAVEEVCAAGASSLTLDLRTLAFIDSTGLAAIVHAGQLCEKHGVSFALVRGSESTQRLFELTGLIDVLPFHDDSDVEPAAEGA